MKKFLLIVAILAAYAVSAEATITTYTDRSAWEAATPGNLLIDFDGIAPEGGYVWLASPLTLGTGYFSTPTYYQFVVDNNFGSEYEWGSNGVYLGPERSPVTVTGSYGAFAADFMTIYDFGVPVRLTVGDRSWDIGTDEYARTFFGFTSDTAIESFTLAALDGYLLLDNIGFRREVVGEETPAVPEPATILLLAAGVVGVLLTKRAVKA